MQKTIVLPNELKEDISIQLSKYLDVPLNELIKSQFLRKRYSHDEFLWLKKKQNLYLIIRMLKSKKKVCAKLFLIIQKYQGYNKSEVGGKARVYNKNRDYWLQKLQKANLLKVTKMGNEHFLNLNIKKYSTVIQAITNLIYARYGQQINSEIDHKGNIQIDAIRKAKLEKKRLKS